MSTISTPKATELSGFKCSAEAVSTHSEDTLVSKTQQDKFHNADNTCDIVDSSSIVFDTSTIEFDHESYETFQHKVLELILQIFPCHGREDIKIHHMKGGDYNRIIDISVWNPIAKGRWYASPTARKLLPACLQPRQKSRDRPSQYILRIPRSPDHDLLQQVTTLTYLTRKMLNTPWVIRSDSSCDNILGHAYMIYERLPGTPLNRLWTTLNACQRKSVVRAVTKLTLKIGKKTNDYAGVISIRNSSHDFITNDVKIEPLPIPQHQATSTATETSTWYLPLALLQTPREFLLSLVDRQRCYAQSSNLPALPKVWNGLMKMIQKLYTLGVLPDDQKYHFHHGNLQAENLLAEIVDEETVKITGILDWDDAIFAPKFMSTQPPLWLWTNTSNELDSIEDPIDPELLAYKREFENAVGEDFCKEAFSTENVLARRLFKILYKGFGSSSDVHVAETLVREFEEKVGSDRDGEVPMG